MRKEAFDIAIAFRDHKRCRRVRTETDGENVWLHGNLIARRDETGVVWLTLAGRPTMNTRNRLNAICEVFDRGRPFYQRRYKQFYGETPISSHDSYPLCGPLGMLALEASMKKAAA